jgi:hypothetical protein
VTEDTIQHSRLAFSPFVVALFRSNARQKAANKGSEANLPPNTSPFVTVKHMSLGKKGLEHDMSCWIATLLDY